jgi:putative transposase
MFPQIRNPLKRYYGNGDLHFVTFSCYRRQPLLGSVHARDRFVEVLDEIRNRHNFLLIGYVVMPEHIHLLLSEPGQKSPSKVLQVIKQKVAKDLLEERRKSAAGQINLRFNTESSGALHFWQRRFYDFNVWSDEKLWEKLNYMHLNPVKRKLVTQPREWPWSSWSHYEKGEQGKIRMDPFWGSS